ncbi:serine hydrolase domain-containing protein [Gymnodinialimonas sp. 2305UL16-5]|uniref:serine hydrolase domain-containing protein n=1 Tax=Gymnodinialimonas mytili TaxID=3126503 RepID=UPI0030A32BA3
MADTMPDTPEAAFDALFDDYAARDPRFAMTAAFAIGDQAPITRVSGPQHTRSDVMVGADVLWHIGSITKSFTATIIMRLSERGLLDIDAPIAGYLPQYADSMHEDWQAVTLRQLLSHTSGIVANPSRFSGFRRSTPDGMAGRLEVLERLWSAPIEPNEGAFAYSNVGYALAGLVAEQVTGHSWNRLIQDEIAAPFGLESLGVGPPTGDNVPWGHRSILGLRFPVDPTDPRADNPDWMGPAGRLHASISDVIRWGQLHLRACAGQRPDFLSAESCGTMWAPREADYGLGWGIQRSDEFDATLIWHNGSNTKWYAVLGMVPERDLVVAVALNTFDTETAEGLFHDLVLALLGEP